MEEYIYSAMEACMHEGLHGDSPVAAVCAVKTRQEKILPQTPN